MAITAALVTSLGGGGGKTFAAAFSGSTGVTRTVGEAGKTYIVYARTGGAFNTKIMVGSSTIAQGNDNTKPLDFEGVEVLSGPVTITYSSGNSAGKATVIVAETTPF
ncbi:hypothetical protein M3G47_01215 [Corynebacterium sanguinis]|uniref:hypothetical protein n=1 Tax=Corynebacterium sanguinis TaxID=2594913 RepID=UPI0021A58B06|nr:hypothetical protein [Corynebacterium sanguinis]MCT1491361.1 hypothetical protein [Corynebacterium sanguinis]MCT2246720.1 hypothetical protein [Corynebacterium sanguinis]